MAQQLYRTVTGQSTKSKQSADGAGAASNPNLQRMTTGGLAGRLNHLTEAQEGKLIEFKQKLEKDGWWTPDGVNGKPSHDDGTLLRYLRARKFDVQGAYGQFSDTEKWMKEEKVENLYEHFDVELYESARAMYPQWTGRRDKRGIPIYVFHIKGLDSKNVSKYQKESETYKKSLPNHKNSKTPAKLLPLFALYHNLLNFVLPLCSSLERPNPEIPVTNSTNIVDIQGVGLGQFWNLKQHMQDASLLATAHYPETLDRIFIIGAPAFFPTVWGWVKRWFDPVTVSKIFILNKNEVKPTLMSFMDIQNIPKKYGGELDWGWGDLPSLGPAESAAVSKDGNNAWVRGPCLWLEGERIVVGNENGTPRRPDKEVAEKKPVVYAADYTEEPVHQDRKASVVSDKSLKANGKATEPVNTPSTVPEGPAAAATATAASATDTPEVTATQPQTTGTEPAAPSLPVDKTNMNIKNSPMGDSQVHLPDAQPAPPAQTAEYISPTPTGAQSEVAAPAVSEVTAPAVAPAPKAEPLPNVNVVQPPPGHTQPGPLPQHQVELTKAIAANLEQESTYTLPAKAGDHPEIIVASDAAKGLAVEADKLNLGEAQNNGRPGVERFFTAQDVKI